MKIQDTKKFKLVAKCEKNTRKSSKARIKFNYDVCKNDTLLSKDKEEGRVYLICVNDEIYKIGYSIAKKGIKVTLNSYGGAMGGRSGINRYGIHLLIYRELEKGNKVDVYVKYAQEVKIKNIIGLNKNHDIKISPAKEFEDICKKDYHDKEGTYPKWNFQENKKQWPKDIQSSHNRQRKKQIDKRP